MQLVHFATLKWNMIAAYCVVSDIEQITWELALKPQLILYMEHHHEEYANPFPVEEREWWTMSSSERRGRMIYNVIEAFNSIQSTRLHSGKMAPLPVPHDMQLLCRRCGCPPSAEVAVFEASQGREL